MKNNRTYRHNVTDALRADRQRLTAERDELSSRLDEMHEIIARKNAIIRLMALGDCTAAELGLSDAKGVALLP